MVYLAGRYLYHQSAPPCNPSRERIESAAMAIDQSLLRRLPAVDEVLRQPEVVRLVEEGVPRWAVTEAVRAEIEARRQAILEGATQPPSDIEAASIATRCRALLRRAW